MQIRWRLCNGNILDQPADVLICSANVYLNLSGGVGGEMLLRCGVSAQNELHEWLKQRQRRFVTRGEIIAGSPHGLPFKTILHAVAVDAFYESSPEVVQNLVENCLTIAAARVALTALATGYGRLSLRQFAEGIKPMTNRDYPPVSEVVICVRNQLDEDELSKWLELNGRVRDC